MNNTNLYFKQLEIGPMANYIYFIGNKTTREVCVVDPAWDVNTILKEADQNDLVIKHILVTHGHPDHINAVEPLINQTNARLHMHKLEVPWMVGWDETVIKRETGDELTLGDIKITFIHTPGHTPGSQCFLVNNRLVSGDTLFIGGCGRTDLPGGNAEQLYDSLANKLSRLDDSIVLCPGHNYAPVATSTLGEEKRTNPYMQPQNLSRFIKTREPWKVNNQD